MLGHASVKSCVHGANLLQGQRGGRQDPVAPLREKVTQESMVEYDKLSQREKNIYIFLDGLFLKESTTSCKLELY